jgi:Tfp pilus assembly protein PilN
MKNDINLLYKRKTRTFSNKKIALIVLLIVLLAAGMYAGIAIPGGMLAVARLEASELESKLNSSTETQQDLTDKTQQEALLALQLTEIKAFDGNRSDMTGYIDAVEASLPTSASITQLQITDDRFEIQGVARDDNAIAAFCLRLREQSVFKDVYITSDTTPIDDNVSIFALTATLNLPLSNVPLIQVIEQGITAPSASPAQDAQDTTLPAEINGMLPEVGDK